VHSGVGTVIESRRLFPRMETEGLFAQRLTPPRSIVVRVRRDDGTAPYDVSLVVRDPIALARLAVGGTVRLLVAAEEPTSVLFDWDRVGSVQDTRRTEPLRPRPPADPSSSAASERDETPSLR
jgi:hypothetical protein